MIKKVIIMIGITFVLSAVLLCGCSEQNSDNETISKFIGTWITTDLYNQTWTFYENNTLKTEFLVEGNLTADIQNWEYKDGELCTAPLSDPNAQRCSEVQFTGTSSFTLKIADDYSMTFNKV